MLFRQHILDGIAAGTVSLAFRRWQRPTVKAGGTLQTAAGLLAIESVEPIAEAEIKPRDVRRAGYTSMQELLASLDDRPGQLYRIDFKRIGDDPRIALRENARLTEDEAASLQLRLARLDALSAAGPWTRQVLALIQQHPERRAADLAALSGYEKDWLKLNIRKLKHLGLTESLAVGYRLAPRGVALLRWINHEGAH